MYPHIVKTSNKGKIKGTLILSFILILVVEL